MKAKSLHYTLLSIIGMALVAGIGGYYLGHQQLDEKIDTLKELNSDIVAARETRSRLEGLEQTYEEARSLEDKSERILPEEKQQSEVTSRIFAMIDDAGLSSEDISYRGTNGVPNRTTQTDDGPLDDVLVMPADFTIEGTYPELLVFLESVERQERLMQVTSLNISRPEDKDELTFNVELEVFLRS